MEERERYIHIINRALEKIENIGILSLLSVIATQVSMLLEEVDRSTTREEKNRRLAKGEAKS